MKENTNKFLIGRKFYQQKSILLILFFMLFSTVAFSQNERFTFNSEKIQLRDLLDKIEKQSSYKFLYRSDAVNKHFVTIKTNKAPLKEVLTIALDKSDLTYKMLDDKLIVIGPKETIESTKSQKITGTVTDAQTGETLIGVSVFVRGTKKGIITDLNGQFDMEVPVGSVVNVSFIGYETQNVLVTNERVLDIRLSLDSKKLDEVVVVGYGTTSRKNLTTAISKIDPKGLTKASSGNVSDLLFGRAAGLQVTTQSSEPDGQIDLSIRGKGTPLYVVDGVAYPSNGLDPGNGNFSIVGGKRGALAGLNPNDVESIEVLKDASAAIYGVAAANGVVLITTKKGKTGTLNVSYDGSRSFANNYPYIQTLVAQDYETYFNQFSKDQYLLDKSMGAYGTIPLDLSGYTPKFSDSQIQSAGRGTDWLGLIMRNGSVDNHNVSISGGTDKVTYFFSGNYFGQKGTIKNSDLQKFSGRMNLSFKVAKFLTLNATANGGENTTSNPSAGAQKDLSGSQGYNALQSALFYPSNVPLRDSNGKFSLFPTLAAPNPVSELDIRDKTIYNTLVANFSADFTIIPEELTAKLMYGSSYESADRDFFIPSTVFFALTNSAKAFLGHSARRLQTAEATVSYRKTFAEIVKLNAVAGVGQYTTSLSGFSVQATDMLDAIGTDNMSTGKYPFVSSSPSGDKKRSFFARTNFDVLDRYMVSLSFRRDGFDKFFPNQKYANFPSASLAWKMTEEPFLHDFKAVSTLKPRVSYGKTGDLNVLGANAYGGFTAGGAVLPLSSNTASGTAIVFGDGVINIPYLMTALDNSSLTWPGTVTFDAGVDFGLFNDRITGSFDWFKENITSLLIVAKTAPLSQIGTAPINAASQVRTGVDFSLNTVNIQSKDFTWKSTINLSHYDFKWDTRYKNDGLNKYVATTDKVNTIYTYHTNGILQIGQTAPVWQNVDGANLPGCPIFVDKNGDSKLDYNDVEKHSGDPTLNFGFDNSFRYKNFDLDIFFYGQTGAWGFNPLAGYSSGLNLINLGSAGSSSIANAWSTTNTNGTLPGVAYKEYKLGMDAVSDVDLIKRDFVKCRNITLGYTLTSLSKYVKSLRVYADIQNPFVISAFKTLDPEVLTTAGGGAPYPMARTFSLGVNVNF